ncbi:MAG: hypothetical protein M3Y56_08425 [Armatimonadota bacterium]|nr:hypothetical protein [Armatimonadota bacterium]
MSRQKVQIAICTIRRPRLSVILFTLTALLLAPVSAGASPYSTAPSTPSPTPVRVWSPALVQSPAAWSDHMNEAVVSSSGGGLRVEVAPGRSWAIAAVPQALLPHVVGTVRVRVRSVEGGGKWLVRLHGDLRGMGAAVDVGPFQSQTGTGLQTVDLDPRLLRLEGQPAVQVQLGVEGPPGASVTFDDLEFLPGASIHKLGPAGNGQRSIEAVNWMPNIPTPFKMIDWKARARNYDRFVFDFKAQGQFLPLIWLDNGRVNTNEPTFGLCSYVGDGRQGTSNEEGINCIGAVLGATLVGVDKRGLHDMTGMVHTPASSGLKVLAPLTPNFGGNFQTGTDYNYVRMCQSFYNSKNGSNLVLNGTSAEPGGSFWYDLWPSIVFDGLAYCYPNTSNTDTIVRTTADRWLEACRALGGSDTTLPNFDHTAFNFRTMQPVDNGHWKEPDAAAGVAWLEYAAWTRWKDPRYLQAADWGLRFLNERKTNPYYECLLPWGALTCARMNAELGRKYDLSKILNWSFGISDARGGWGVTLGRWGGYDCAGLVGSVDNRGGYAFAMNTFAQAGALVPVARYDPRYARALGKWMLNLANAARLFYLDGLPPDHGTSAFWKGDPQGVIAYEGLRREWLGMSPCATGDPVAMKWGPKTDLGLYGSSYVGFLGGIIGRTNDEKILALDCLVTDFFHPKAFPTKLIYNPYSGKKQIELRVGSGRHDLYDSVSHRFIAHAVNGSAHFTLPGDTAAVIAILPTGGKLTHDDRKLLVNGVVVDYGVQD